MINMIYKGMAVNGVPLESSVCSNKIVKILTKGGTTEYVQLFYDSGSQLTRCNQYCAPMATYVCKSQKPITITSLHEHNSTIRQIHNIILSDTLSTEAVLFPTMQIKVAVSNCLFHCSM